MKIIKAIVRPHLYEQIAESLAGIGVVGITATDCMGHGRQNGYTELNPDINDVKYVDKVNLEIAVMDDRVDEVIVLLEETARSGQVGDGKIFIRELYDAVRIRDGMHGIPVL